MAIRSLYGDTRKLSPNSFVFDKIYTSRIEMDAAIAKGSDGFYKDDGVYVGRYVLISYTGIPSQRWYVEDDSGNLVVNSEFSERANKDAARYGQSYNNTVWQKINDASVIKYMLIAELDAEIPACNLNVIQPIKPIELINNSNIKQFTFDKDFSFTSSENKFCNINPAHALTSLTYNNITYTIINIYFADINGDIITQFRFASSNKGRWREGGASYNEKAIYRADSISDPYYYNNSGGDDGNIASLLPKSGLLIFEGLSMKVAGTENDDDAIIYSLSNANLTINSNQATLTGEFYQLPSFDYEHSNDLSYILNFPEQLKLNVDDKNIDYNAEGFSIETQHYIDSPVNEIKWTSTCFDGDENQYIDTKVLNIKLQGIGNVMSTLYDIIYGAPEDGSTERQYSEEELIRMLNDALDRAFHEFTPNAEYVIGTVVYIAEADGTKKYYVCTESTEGGTWEQVKNNFTLIPDFNSATTYETKGTRVYYDNAIYTLVKPYDDDLSEANRKTPDNEYWSRYDLDADESLSSLAGLLGLIYNITHDSYGNLTYLSDWVADRGEGGYIINKQTISPDELNLYWEDPTTLLTEDDEGGYAYPDNDEIYTVFTNADIVSLVNRAETAATEAEDTKDYIETSLLGNTTTENTILWAMTNASTSATNAANSASAASTSATNAANSASAASTSATNASTSATKAANSASAASTSATNAANSASAAAASAELASATNIEAKIIKYATDEKLIAGPTQSGTYLLTVSEIDDNLTYAWDVYSTAVLTVDSSVYMQ